MKERKKIGIVGVGLIGGSLALRLHQKKISSLLVGVEEDPSHAQQAIELELVDEIMSLENAIATVDVIILAIPVNTILKLLPGMLDKINGKQIILDVGSSKKDIISLIKDHPMRGRYVSTHPMWGTEYSGPAAALPTAFDGKAVILCDSKDSDTDALQWVKSMYQKIGMRLLEMDSNSHDVHVAYVSHISHITSFALANTVLEKEKEDKAIFALASAGFESTVRLAKSNAAMWVPIFMQNKENILEVLDEHISQLSKFRNSIAEMNATGIEELIFNANKIKRIIQ